MQKRIYRTILWLIVASLATPIWAANQKIDVFQIKRNKNRNLVQFAVQVNSASCKAEDPEDDDDWVVNYWRDLEISPTATDKVKFYEQPAYGIKSQTRKGGKLYVRLKALPEKLITISFKKAGEKCKAIPFVKINGNIAVFKEVYVYAEEGFITPTVKWIEIRGFMSGKQIVEKIIKDD